MNGYERMMAAMRHEQPDRVPIVAAAVSQNVMDAILYEGVTYEDFVDRMDSDAILISGQDGSLADWIDEHRFRDEWGVDSKVTDVQKVTYPRVGSPVDGPIKSERTLTDTCCRT